MNLVELKKSWLEEETKVFSGWDFSYLEDRTTSAGLPWDYEKLIRDYLKFNDKLLDMGTGGGEFLLTLGHPYKNTFATEAYPPNYHLCKSRLGSLGISVTKVEEDYKLPYENGSFEMIINRHESFDISEVYRILKPGGVFITQQVGELNNLELAKFVTSNDHLVYDIEKPFKQCVADAKRLGLEILEESEHFSKMSFHDIGALVYLAKIIEWEFVDFSVEEHFDRLLTLHKKLEQGASVEGLQHRYLLIAKKV